MSEIQRDSLPAALVEHLRRHAAVYYPDLAGQRVDVRAGQVRRRQFAELCTLEIEAAGGVKRILAKAALPSNGQCVSVSDVSTRFLATPDPLRSEFNALTSLSDHLADNGDSRFFSVRVLDSILEDRVLLLEFVDARSLARMLPSASRLGRNRNRPALREAIHRTGACLKAFHAMETGPQRRLRGAAKEEFLEWVEAGRELVESHAFSRNFFRAACPRLLALAERWLPETLPIGPVHDDFAPRNVLVNACGQVALIDMLEEWNGCVWEDVAHFLFSLGANKPQAFTSGRFFAPAVMDEFRAAFLSGYFGDERIPIAEILLYESQVTLSTWAAQWRRAADASGWRGVVQRRKLAVSIRWYAQQVKRCLAQLEACADAPRRKQKHASRLSVGGPS